MFWSEEIIILKFQYFKGISEKHKVRGASPIAQLVNNSPANAKNTRFCMKRRFNPWVRKSPWRRAWEPTPVFLPGESHGQSSLVGYSSWSLKESDTTEHACTCTWVRTHARAHTHTHTHTLFSCKKMKSCYLCQHGWILKLLC